MTPDTLTAPTGFSFDLSEEQRAVREMVRDFAESEIRPIAAKIDETHEFPLANAKKMGELGLMGMFVPDTYSGAGLDYLSYVIAIEELSRVCASHGVIASAHNSLVNYPILAYGSEAQKQKYLPKIASGDLMLAICMTEPETGSDISNMSTVARDDGDYLVIDGEKALISRGDVAGLFVVWVKFVDDPGPRNIGAILVERDTPGFEVMQSYPTLGGESLFGLKFTKARVPRENVLVREDGFRKMLTAFNGQRCLNASICVGIAQGAQDAAVTYAKQRKQFGRAISEYQGIQWMLADNELEIEAARLLLWRAAARAGSRFPSRTEAAIAKITANEMALRVTDRAMQVFGGHGFLKEMPPERFLRWARYGSLGGGTPQILRNAIGRHLVS
jgi:alkylation response protein AidB-like acyl-CoA dehydrogenase